MKSHRSKKNSRLMIALKMSAFVSGILSVLLGLILFFMPKPFYSQGFKNLTEISNYAGTLDELTKMDSDNAVKPDFSTFYKRYQSTVSKNIKDKVLYLLNKVHLVKAPIFSASFFKFVLDDLNKLRETKGYKGTTANKITAAANSKFVVWGDLQGAFHSLVRDLGKLKELGIISDDLKILNQDHYFIFLGNIPSRSPFSMETLGLVMRLMQVNPDQVLYLKGSHETDDYWQEHTLNTELKIRAAHLSTKSAPIEAEVSKFFNSLPTIIYLATSAQNEFVRMAYSARASLPDAPFAKFLTTKQSEKVGLLSWTGKTPASEGSTPDVTIKAIVKIEKKRETYQQSEGLRLTTPDGGVTSWTMLSAPTLAAEMGFKFFNDTFAIIDAAEKMDDWKITLYFQDRRQKSGFSTKLFYLTSGLDGAAARPATGGGSPSVQGAAQPTPPVASPSSQAAFVGQQVPVAAQSVQPASTTPVPAVPQQTQPAGAAQPVVQPQPQAPVQPSTQVAQAAPVVQTIPSIQPTSVTPVPVQGAQSQQQVAVETISVQKPVQAVPAEKSAIAVQQPSVSLQPQIQK